MTAANLKSEENTEHGVINMAICRMTSVLHSIAAMLPQPNWWNRQSNWWVNGWNHQFQIHEVAGGEAGQPQYPWRLCSDVADSRVGENVHMEAGLRKTRRSLGTSCVKYLYLC